ncbi:MAG: 5-(carboxyamino)imidazole ribonucleotide mutase [Armatimonadota bacterium]|nr:MAG: 5-(carboxyamino)imidazole ribonucleotide mutase [Armatimonadota bacterium]
MAATVAVIMGSESDLQVMQDALRALDELGIEREAHVMSAHRTPQSVARFAAGARERGLKVIIAGAGRAAHLAGAVAAHTTLPVIGVPVAGGTLGGMDALLGMAQMPRGVPVATVAINGARNAALLAAEILALEDARLRAALDELRAQMAEDVADQSQRLAEKP